MELQPDLFGMPTLDPKQSQFHTPMWLARRMAGWLRRGWRVLEPCCGSGNLIEGFLRAGHNATAMHALERDVRWVEYARKRFDYRVHIMAGDFLRWVADRTFDAVLANYPYEENQHLEMTLRSLELAPVVVTVVPISFEFSERRDRELWAARGVVRRRARLPERVKFSGAGGEIDCEVLWIGRRMQRRRVGEERQVFEETWLPDDLPEAA